MKQYVVVMDAEEQVIDGMEVDSETYVYELTAIDRDDAMDEARLEWQGYNGDTHNLLSARYTVIEGKIV